jgi:hypothetical protein
MVVLASVVDTLSIVQFFGIILYILAFTGELLFSLGNIAIPVTTIRPMHESITTNLLPKWNEW